MEPTMKPRIALVKGQLQEDTDYLFCPLCNSHVPCKRVPAGGWEVECPGCIGECVSCACYLKRFCFGSREQFPPFDVNS
jgi:hypothetical protein